MNLTLRSLYLRMLIPGLLIILNLVGLLVEEGYVEGTERDDCSYEDDMDCLLVVINLLDDMGALGVTDVVYAKLVS